MATDQLTEDQLNDIDDALNSGTAIQPTTVVAIAARYGINAESYDTAFAQIKERRSHPAVGPTGRRALDALALYLALAAAQ